MVNHVEMSKCFFALLNSIDTFYDYIIHVNEKPEKFERFYFLIPTTNKPAQSVCGGTYTNMGGRQRRLFSPLTVVKSAQKYIKIGLMKYEPAWLRPVLNTPPMSDLGTRPAVNHHGRPSTKPHDPRRIQSILGGWEVHFRRKFYKQHPWELARPRIVVEDDGADYSRQDWSKMAQIGTPLSGER